MSEPAFPLPSPTDEPDIVRVILDRIGRLLPDLDPKMLGDVETEVRAQYGGMRVRIPKRKKHLADDVRARLVRDALGTASDGELIERYGVSRATLYRQVKRGVVDRGK